MIRIICLVFFCLNFCVCWSQESLNGIVVSNNKPVSYAAIKNHGTNQISQTNEKGEFVLDFLSKNDSLSIFCLGFKSSKIKVSDIMQSKMINLIEKEEVLDEIVITIDRQNEDKNWKVFGKKHSKNIQNFEPIIEGCGIVTSYVINKDVKVSAIRFIVYSNPLPKDYVDKNPKIKKYRKKVRAIFMKNSLEFNDNMLPNHFVEIDYKEKGQYLEVNFGESIELKVGDTISFGLELIPEDLKSTIKDNLIGIATVSNDKQNKQKTIRKTFKPKEIAEQVCNSVVTDDIYFELQIEK